MEDEKPPITISELLQLSNLGINRQHVTWLRVTMTSDTHICIRYENTDNSQSRHKSRMQKQLMILNMKRDGCSHKTWPMNPESAMVSPLVATPKNGSEARIGIRTGNTLMVLRLEPSWEMVAKCHVEDIQYWTWLNTSLLGIVTDKYVFHWDIDQGGIPERMFSRHQRLSFSEIISYKCDPDMRWFALTGLLPQEDAIVGVTQLYSVDSFLTQCITAHSVTFLKYRFDGNQHPSTVLCIASRDPTTPGFGKVHVVELGPHRKGNLAPCSYYDHIKFVENGDKYDFPVSLQVSTRYGLVYVASKYGHMYVCDLDTAACLFATRISLDIVFTTVLNTSTEGIVAISRNGQVLAIDVKTKEIVNYIRNTAKKHTQADRLEQVLAQHCSVSGQSLI